MSAVVTVDPATGERLAEYPAPSDADVDVAGNAALLEHSPNTTGCALAVARVLAGVRPGMPAHDEAVLGPVAAVVEVDGEDEAVRVGNDTRYGLGASVWTADPDRGIAVARRIHPGAAFVDAVVASDVRMPFGNTRASGYGRELAAAGLREFVDVRTWWVLDEPAVTAPASE